MSPIGPTLPPHLTSKRKWSEEELRDSEQKHRSRSSSIENGEKRRKILGPAPPPAPINERPMEPAGKIESKEDSDSDDDFGPALASNSETADVSQTFTENMQNLADTDGPPARSLQREEWMLAPPSQGDWTSRIDPTKLKNRRFNTGKGARAPNQILQPENTLWTETPEQKRRRLQDEVMGVAQPKPVDGPVSQSAKSQGQAIDTRRKVQEYNDKRGSSLLQQQQKGPTQDEDDPSKRAFDRDKDIGGSIMSAQRKREFMSKAADVGSKFSRGSYL